MWTQRFFDTKYWFRIFWRNYGKWILAIENLYSLHSVEKVINQLFHCANISRTELYQALFINTLKYLCKFRKNSHYSEIFILFLIYSFQNHGIRNISSTLPGNNENNPSPPVIQSKASISNFIRTEPLAETFRDIKLLYFSD